MRVKFNQSLGHADADTCRRACGCDCDALQCVEGTSHDMPANAVAWLQQKYPALLTVEQPDPPPVKPVAKESPVKAVKSVELKGVKS